MEDTVPWGSREYFLLLGFLLFSRGMDFLSTWIATPNLILEANPLAKRLGWRGGIAVNLLVCVTVGHWPLPSVMICTTSLLVASHNFQVAWLMRSMGEEYYRQWFIERVQETPPGLLVFCLLGQTVLVAIVGLGLVFFGAWYLVPFGIGLGIITYAIAVTTFTMLAWWRNRRAKRPQL